MIERLIKGRDLDRYNPDHIPAKYAASDQPSGHALNIKKRSLADDALDSVDAVDFDDLGGLDETPQHSIELPHACLRGLDHEPALIGRAEGSGCYRNNRANRHSCPALAREHNEVARHCFNQSH
jgi:hypothetical protein